MKNLRRKRNHNIKGLLRGGGIHGPNVETALSAVNRSGADKFTVRTCDTLGKRRRLWYNKSDEIDKPAEQMTKCVLSPDYGTVNVREWAYVDTYL